MKPNMMKKSAVLALAAAQLAGCTGVTTQRTEALIAENQLKVAELKAQAGIDGGPKAATARVNRPFFGSKSVPYKARAVLPEKLREEYEFRFPGARFTVEGAAEKIASITGVPIRIASDVNVPGEYKVAHLNAKATGAAILDQVCRETNLSWEIRDGVVVVQRFVTRSFTLMTQPGQQSFDFNVGKSGQSQASGGTTGNGGTISTGFTSSSTVGKSAKQISAMQSTLDAIAKVVSKDAKVIGSEATGSIQVVGTQDDVDRAQRVVDRENEVLTRAATFHIEIISFRSNDDDQSGIDWQAAFSNLNKFGAALTSPKTLTNSNGGTLNFQLLSGTGSTGRFDGTKAFVNLLNEYGKTAVVYKNDVRTRNRTTTSVQSLNQTVYIARTTPAPAAIGGLAGGVPGIEPGTVTAGIDLKVLPMIFDSNQISLMFNLGIVDLTDIAPLSSGEGANKLTIEGPETKGFEFSEETPLTPGVTTLISGYERTMASYARRKLGRDVTMALGGSFKGGRGNEQLFILITPTIVGSMY